MFNKDFRITGKHANYWKDLCVLAGNVPDRDQHDNFINDFDQELFKDPIALINALKEKNEAFTGTKINEVDLICEKESIPADLLSISAIAERYNLPAVIISYIEYADVIRVEPEIWQYILTTGKKHIQESCNAILNQYYQSIV